MITSNKTETIKTYNTRNMEQIVVMINTDKIKVRKHNKSKLKRGTTKDDNRNAPGKTLAILR